MALWKAVCIFSIVLILQGCRLHVHVDGPGSVVSDDGTINCPGHCSRDIAGHDNITLTLWKASSFCPT